MFPRECDRETQVGQQESCGVCVCVYVCVFVCMCVCVRGQRATWGTHGMSVKNVVSVCASKGTFVSACPSQHTLPIPTHIDITHPNTHCHCPSQHTLTLPIPTHIAIAHPNTHCLVSRDAGRCSPKTWALLYSCPVCLRPKTQELVMVRVNDVRMYEAETEMAV